MGRYSNDNNKIIVEFPVVNFPGQLETVETETGNGKRKKSNLGANLLNTTSVQRPPLYKDHIIIIS